MPYIGKIDDSLMSNAINIVPRPSKVVVSSEKFVLSNRTIIQTDLTSKEFGNYLCKVLQSDTRLSLQTTEKNTVEGDFSVIILNLNENLKDLGSEGYQLRISSNKATVSAPTLRGIFYGIQSIRQLIFQEIHSQTSKDNNAVSIQCLDIEDVPRFSWRGFMLDVGRHFFDKEVVKKLIDVMALLKMNIFHLHLTEDQGWRIEIKKYPLLTEIGSKRKESQIGGFLSKERDGIPHAGFFTQENIREIVAYAKERFIEVIPEIEMPGHCMAALASYPELSCSGGPFEVPIAFGIKSEVYCTGKERVFVFLEDVLKEVMDLFPSKIVHIGGDEVRKLRWKECPDCQARIKNENLESENDLQTYFVNRIEAFLASHNRIMLGWNDIFDDTLAKNAIVQYWRKAKKTVIKHLRSGRNIVISWNKYVYFDYNYNYTPLSKCYLYEPIPKELENKYHKFVLGIESPLWTEWVPNTKRLYYQAFPRLIAVAEIGWTSKENKDFASFKVRLEKFLKILDSFNVNYAPNDQTETTPIKRLIAIPKRFKGPEFL